MSYPVLFTKIILRELFMLSVESRRALEGNAKFYTPVHFPESATVTQLTWAGVDPWDDSWGKLKLIRCDLAGNTYEMALVNSTSSGGSQTDTTISYSSVDNSQYQYYLQMELFGAVGSSAIVQYTSTGP